jgi:hypothetical protein
MAKHAAPVQAFQDLLNVYVSNGWFPWGHKIVKNASLDKLVHHSYSVAELFSVESGLHEFVNWKTNGHAWKRE